MNLLRCPTESSIRKFLRLSEGSREGIDVGMHLARPMDNREISKFRESQRPSA